MEKPKSVIPLELLATTSRIISIFLSLLKKDDFVLEALSELRIETNIKCTIQLKSGLAEIFGTELSKNKEYIFPNGGKFAVFTWHSCTVTISF